MILLSTGSLYNYGLNRVFELAKKAGFKNLELMISKFWDTRQPEYLSKLKQEHNIDIYSVHSPLDTFFKWDTYEKCFQYSLKLAKDIKAKFVIIHPYEPNDKTFNSWLCKNLSKIQDKTKMKIVVENLPKRDGENKSVFPKKGQDPTKMKNFSNLCLDTTHLATTKLDLLKTYKKIKDKLCYIHFSDSSNFVYEEQDTTHLIPGKGKLPLKEFLSILKEDKFRGVISLELRPETIGAGNENQVLKNLIKSRQFIKTYFGE